MKLLMSILFIGLLGSSAAGAAPLVVEALFDTKSRMPGVLIQAMACGAPAVSTNCPSGPDEIIDRPGENGLLVPVKDPIALAEAMKRVLTDSSLAARLKTNGRLAVQKFRVEDAISSYISAIES